MPPKPTQSTPRRQDLPLTSRDVADSNNHLSKVFGGTQKSWMTPAAANSNNSSVASNGNLPKSNSNASPSNPPLTVISSDVRPNAKRGRGRPRKYPEPTSGHSGPPPTTLPNPPPGPVDVTLPSPALTNEPSPAHSNRHVTPQNEAPATASAVSLNPSSTTPGQEEQHLSRQAASTLPSTSSIADNEGNLTNETALNAAPSQQAATPSSAALIPAASETQIIKRGRGPDSEDWTKDDAAAEHPLKRARMTGLTECDISANESYQRAMGMYSENLQKHLVRAGGMSGLVGLEKHRYKLLLEACTNLDGFYLIIHQLFCAWTEHTDIVHQLLAPVAASKVNKAFEIMRSVLLCNEGLGQEHRTHFANWPRKLEVLDAQMTVSKLYQLHLLQVREFVENLADKWNSILAVVQSRGYPLLANELMHSFRCWSIVMRRILFTVSRRLLGVKDKIAAQLNSLWDQDQGAELEALKGGVLEADLEKHRASLRQQHKTATVDARHKAQLLDTGPESRSLTPVSALNPPPPDSCADGASDTPDTLTSLTGQYPVTSITAATSQPEANPQAAVVTPSLAVTAAVIEHEGADDVTESAQCIRPRQEQQGFAHGSYTVGQGSAQAPVSQRRDNPRVSPVGVPDAVNSPSAQAQPQIPTQASNARPATAFPGTMVGSHHSDSRRVAFAPNLPSITRELVLPSQRPQSQALQSQSPLHTAARYVQPYEGGMQQRGPGIQTAANGAILRPPRHPGRAQSTQAPFPNSAGQQLSHATPNQAPRSHDARFVSEAHPRMQQQFHPITQMPYTALSQQSQPSSPSFYQTGSTSVRHGMFPAPTAGSTPQHIAYPRNVSMPARGQAPYPTQYQVRPELVPAFIPRAIPDNEAPTSPHDWVSAHVAAHLPQLRSPLRKPLPAVTGRHYQHVETFCVLPWRVDPGHGVRSTTFGLSNEDMMLHHKKTLDSSGFEVYPYADGTRRLRLRCCLLPESAPEQVGATWAETPTKWPSEVYISFNGRNLNTPSKQHFRHDMPLELTEFLVTGNNELKLVLPKRSALANGKFWFAIESVAVHSLHSLLKAVSPVKRAINPRQMEKMIAQRLSCGLDEEVQIASDSGLKISITDPWTSVMFEMPVRGVRCEHLECFDLKTFLQTRPGKTTPHKPNQEPSLVDCWKCPICDRDARPCSLSVDLYMLRVRNELVAQGKGNCKAIVAQADGSWSAVEEPDDDDDDDDNDDDDDKPPSRRGQPARSSVGRPTEVIEILDD